MPAFTGQLNANEIFASIYNMIISQEVFADNIQGSYSEIVDKARVDGGLYGDTKLYYSTDALFSDAWGDDAESANLLAISRPSDPEVQGIQLDIFRQIRITIDNYLSKRAWSSEGAFASFTAVMLGWIGETKRVYDSTTYNCFLGTAVDSASVKGEVDVTLPAADGTEAIARVRGQQLSKAIADLLVQLKRPTRDFNSYGQLRSYSPESVKIVWNAAYLNEITYLDLPSIFHIEKLSEKLVGDILPAEYFGAINAAATQGDGATIYSLVEQKITTGGVTSHYFAGDLIKVTDTAPAGTSYTQDEKVICKVMTQYPPYMSAFEVGTSFFNPRSLNETHFLTWGHNTLEFIKGKPFITLSEVNA